MDREKARFILSCFRPDGADADDPAFAEALQLAASDRELGEWLARERARDADFSSALNRIELPDSLRCEILAGLAAERGDTPEIDEIDSSLIGALAAISPPAGLKQEILIAMENSAPSNVTPIRKPSGSKFAKLGVPIAAAAGIALAFILTGNNDKSPVVTNPGSGSDPIVSPVVPISHVEKAAMNTLTSPDFALDHKESKHGELFSYVQQQGRPCPEKCLPKGLKEMPGIGCRKLDVDGKPGSIVCFRRGDSDAVHMVIFYRDDVDCDKLPDRDNAEINQHGEWAVARWKEKGRVFLLLGNTDTEKLGSLF